MFCHVDADSFFASVLIRKDPTLRGKPLLALGMGGGCVIAATYEAKAKGVKTGMRLRDALALCPEAIRLPSDFRETAVASREIEEILAMRAPLLEQMSVDEWFLDLRSLPGGIPRDPGAWATALREDILRKTALSVSIGVAPTKLLAKMAGEYRKPGGITVVNNIPAGQERSCPAGMLTIGTLLKDRPAAAIPGIGRRRDLHAQAHGWITAWDFANADPETVRKLFGKPGVELQRELLGEEVSPIVTDPDPPKSVSRARSFPGTADRAFLWAHVLRHLEYAVLKMRRHGLACRRIGVWLRDGEYDSEGEDICLPRPMDTAERLCPYAEHCFSALFHPGTRVTQTGIVLAELSPNGTTQGSLFEEPRNLDREEAIQKTLDALHARYGRNAITRGAALRVKSGTQPEMPYSIL